jgi:hypothetical protein
MGEAPKFCPRHDVNILPLVVAARIRDTNDLKHLLKTISTIGCRLKPCWPWKRTLPATRMFAKTVIFAAKGN